MSGDVAHPAVASHAGISGRQGRISDVPPSIENGRGNL